MGAALGAAIDFCHALLMAAWVLGLPLLFWRRHRRLSFWYAVFAIAFVAVNQISRAFLGECVLTTLARAARGSEAVSPEWFTVRAAEAIFHLTPSHRGIKLATEALVFVTAIGVAVRTVRALPQSPREASSK